MVLIFKVIVLRALMERTAIHAKKITTTIHCASLAIATRQESSLSLLVAVQYQLENFASAKNVFKEESAINVVHSIGI